MTEALNSEGSVEKKVFRKLSRYEKESRFLRKRSEEYDVLEEVFDRPTLLTLNQLMNDGVLKYLNGVVNSGKEARIYWGVRENAPDVAVKIFLTVAKEFSNRQIYIYGDPRFKNIRRKGAGLVEIWARKEFANLQAAYQAGVPVPKPITVKRNVLIMEFIGSNGVAAPTLSQAEVGKTDYSKTIQFAKRLYRKASLVHADLSEFNVFKHQGKQIMFDFGTGVDVKHPMAEKFLKRDIYNIHRFFWKRGINLESFEEAFQRVLKA
ncbi:MAG: serine protein kinase RIO [Thaumarchaeota archaeon]|nr:serine protein kinase RIO [Nitrososphaerota archaeon]